MKKSMNARRLALLCFGSILFLLFQNLTYINTTAPITSSTLYLEDTGQPKKSDVIFSARGKNASEAALPLTTLEVARSFHGTRLAWHYPLPNYPNSANSTINLFLRAGLPVQCALPHMVPNTRSELVQNPAGEWVCTNNLSAVPGACLNINGAPVNSPLTKTNCKQEHHDINTAYFKSMASKALKDYQSYGCTSLQQDNPYSQHTNLLYGGCFGSETMQQFASYLRDIKKDPLPSEFTDYAHYLRQKGADANDLNNWMKNPAHKDKYWDYYLDFVKYSTINHYQDLRRQAEVLWQRKILFSFNQGPFIHPDGKDWETGKSWLNAPFNESVTEIHSSAVTPQAISTITEKNTLAGMVTTFTLADADLLLNRQLIASSYASGSYAIIPWDIYVGLKLPRYFASPADYEAYYRMIQDNKTLFDDFPEVKNSYIYFPTVSSRPKIAKGLLIQSVTPAAPVQVTTHHSSQGSDTQTVVHVINWSTENRSAKFTINLNPNELNGEIDSVEIFAPGKSPRQTPFNGASIDVDEIDVWAVVLIRHSRKARAGLAQNPASEQQNYALQVKSLNANPISHYRFKVGLAAETDCKIGAGYSAKNYSITAPLTDEVVRAEMGLAPIGAAKICLVGRLQGDIADDSWQAWAQATEITWNSARAAKAGLQTLLLPEQQDYALVVASQNRHKLSHYRFKAGLASDVDCKIGAGYSPNQGVASKLTDEMVEQQMGQRAIGEMKLCLIGRIDDPEVLADSWQPWTQATEITWNSAREARVGLENPPTAGQNDYAFKLRSANQYLVSHYLLKAGLRSKINCSLGEGYSELPIGIEQPITNKLITAKFGKFVTKELKICVRGRIAGEIASDSWQPARSALEITWP